MDDYGLLRNYIQYTFARLSHEKKIKTGGKYAAFNTGLVDRFYMPIYALFDKNIQRFPEWKWRSFCVAGQGADGKLLSTEFNFPIQAAQYFENLEDIYFDSDAQFLFDVQHIVLDGIKADRYPHKFLNEYAGGFSEEEYEIDSSKYLRDLSNKINNDIALYRNLVNRLEVAIKLAQDKARWNYRAVVPQYYVEQKKMSLLLPLALYENEKIDAALVVQPQKAKGKLQYQAYTIFPLSYAYQNARLVAKPISDWLNPETIFNS